MTVAVELVGTEREARLVAELLSVIWPGGAAPVEPGFAWVLARWGNYVAIATIDGEPVGASIGVRAVDEDGPHLHSHVTGVLPGREGTGLGWAIKQHQRAWARAAGLDRIAWTFDPLVTRNAYFNVTRLGARVPAYYVDFYGPMTDGVNAGDQTDRCLASWQLADPRPLAEPVGSIERVLTVGTDGRPVRHDDHGDAVEVELPRDILALRRTDPELAARWRLAVRDVLQPAYAAGRRITHVRRDGSYLIS